MGEEPCRVSFRDGRLASRKAEEAACRRFQAASWIESMVGPLGLPPQPSEQEFVSCLRSGLILCNTINKIQPGAVPKIVTNQSTGASWETQPLPAYQYFENIRNFLVAVEELKLPSFEASDIERDTIEVGSAAKIVDCLLALKSYHEWKQCGGENGLCRLVKSPVVPQSAGRIQSHIASLFSSVCCRRLDLPTTFEKQQSIPNEDQKSEDALDLLSRLLSDIMFNSKENVDQNLLDSWRQGEMDSVKLCSKIMSGCLDGHQLKSFLKDVPAEGSILKENSTTKEERMRCNLCWGEDSCHHWRLLEAQENDLKELKALLLRTRSEYESLQTELQNDFAQLGNQIQGLSAAAMGYDKAVKENRHLYNMLQELRGNIQVFCRIRPIFNMEAKSSIDYIGNDGSLMVLDPRKSESARKIFQFNKVFGPNATQDVVYKDTQTLIRSVMDGYNVCIFAYGQTGSGKTHTMCGPSSGARKEMGINYMALKDLFELSSSREDVEYDITAQMVEIYNEQVRDLLGEDASTAKLEIRNCSNNGGFSLPDAKMQLVRSTADVLNLMKMGEKNRAFSSTAMNHRSSRSHSVLTVHVHGKDISGNAIRSCLHLVDLAGSERVDKSEATGDRLKEAQHINKSLSCLGDVIAALAQKSTHIPYRNSKLTQLLQNSLGGHAKMLMFAHVSPEADSYGETISTLKFAQRVSNVEVGAAHINKESNEIRELKEQVDSLRKSLASKEVECAVASHKMKENILTMERSKQMTDRTPPRPRRLSIENMSAVKTGTAPKPDEKRILKSPISRLKYDADNSLVHNRRLGSKDANYENNLQESQFSASHLYLKISEGDPPKENILSPQEVQQDRPLAKVGLNNEKCVSITAQEVFSQFSSGTCNSSCQSHLPKMESKIPLRQPRTPDSMRTSNKVAPDEATFLVRSQTRSSNMKASSRGSHLRKSLQSLGKLINGSERRNVQGPLETSSSKFVGKNNTDERSPVTADARSRRRQSLTGVQTLESNVSRRSSLGGKSVDAYSGDIQNTRTPPTHPSAKATKRWL